jgi:hypothetical protein
MFRMRRSKSVAQYRTAQISHHRQVNMRKNTIELLHHQNPGFDIQRQLQLVQQCLRPTYIHAHTNSILSATERKALLVSFHLVVKSWRRQGIPPKINKSFPPPSQPDFRPLLFRRLCSRCNRLVLLLPHVSSSIVPTILSIFVLNDDTSPQ